MDLLRKFLVRLRREYYGDAKTFFLKAGGVTAVLALLTLLVDWLLPFNSWAMLLRSALLVPTAVAIFAVFYGVSLRLHSTQVASRDDWIPFRARFSQRWRLQIAAVIMAFLFVFTYAATRGVGYTLTSSVIGAIGIGLLAFVRSTKDEAKRTRLGVPDARDVSYDARKRAYEREREAKKAAKARKSAANS